MKTQHKQAFQISALIFLVLTLTLNLLTAMIVEEVTYNKFSPGQETDLTIEIKNTLEEDVTEVSLNLDFSLINFIAVGSSEDSIDEINEDDEEKFSFNIKAGNDLTPGDYSIPYTLTYNLDNETKQKIGTIGISVYGEAELSFTLETKTPVVGNKGKISLKIINKGFGDAKFISVKTIPSGYTLLSEKEIYIGTINSDDFDTASFDVIFDSKDAKLNAVIIYKDFDNQEISQTIDMPLTIYSKEQGIELGIIQKNNTLLYLGVIIFLALVWFISRKIKKRKRMNKVNGEK